MHREHEIWGEKISLATVPQQQNTVESNNCIFVVFGHIPPCTGKTLSWTQVDAVPGKGMPSGVVPSCSGSVFDDN